MSSWEESFQENSSTSSVTFLHVCTKTSSTQALELLEDGCSGPSADTNVTVKPLQNYKYVFIFAQILHGVGAAALITLGTIFIDESVTEKMAPVFVSIFEASFVFGPAFG